MTGPEGQGLATWEDVAARAEQILRECRQEVRSLTPGAMVFQWQQARLSTLAEEAARVLAIPRAECEARLMPFERKLAELCGL